MASMATFEHTNCVFKCSDTAQDSLEHYCICSKLSEAISGIKKRDSPVSDQHMDEFFGIVKGLNVDEKLTCARLL